VRLLGYIVMAAGAWYHAPWIFGLGLLIILFAWLNGILLKRKMKCTPSSPNPSPTKRFGVYSPESQMAVLGG